MKKEHSEYTGDLSFVAGTSTWAKWVTELNSADAFEYYLKLPLIMFEISAGRVKTQKDISIDSIQILNHYMDISSHSVQRYDGKLFTYNKFTEYNPDEFTVGNDPDMDYMPGENVAPAILVCDRIAYRTPDLLWFPLTDIADAISLKQYSTKAKMLPIVVLSGNYPMLTLMNAARPWLNSLPPTTSMQ